MTRREFRRARRVVIRKARLVICDGKLGALFAARHNVYRRGSNVHNADALWVFPDPRQRPSLATCRMRHADVMYHLATLDPARLP